MKRITWLILILVIASVTGQEEVNIDDVLVEINQ